MQMHNAHVTVADEIDPPLLLAGGGIPRILTRPYRIGLACLASADGQVPLHRPRKAPGSTAPVRQLPPWSSCRRVCSISFERLALHVQVQALDRNESYQRS